MSGIQRLPAGARVLRAQHDAGLANHQQAPVIGGGNGIKMIFIGIVDARATVLPAAAAVEGIEPGTERANGDAVIGIAEPHIHQWRCEQWLILHAR